MTTPRTALGVSAAALAVVLVYAVNAQDEVGGFFASGAFLLFFLFLFIINLITR